MSFLTHLDVQPDVPDLERRSLTHIDAHKVGRILVENVDMPQAIQQEFLADGARHCREESHGGYLVVEAPLHGLQAGRTPTAVSGVSPYVVENWCVVACCRVWAYRDATGPCLNVGVWAQVAMRGPGDDR